MIFKIFRTNTFEKDFEKLPKKEQEEIDDFEGTLVASPFLGKPLGFAFFREKRIGGRRIYYLIYEDVVIILMVAISDKKTQQATIDAIKSKLDDYYYLVHEELKKI